MTMKILLLLSVLVASCQAFMPAGSASRSITHLAAATSSNEDNNNGLDHKNSRRSLLFSSAAFVSLLSLSAPQPAFAALSTVNTEEFEVILRDSGRSIQIVEFAGTTGDQVTVKLVDGTLFGISGIIESPSDPRSPLKIAAMCRQYKVPTKFLAMESALEGTPRKKVVYMNNIVQTAQEKNVLKAERMRQDEEARVAAVLKMEQEAAQRN
mmetsp:Transcript_5358/g.8797  ORF Transcript_5358/g.8797 Transcript_5358/m.8797 type:complete len:210 (-) Transcript_5358:34-663(-)